MTSELMSPETLQLLMDKGYALGTSALLAMGILIIGWIGSKYAQRLVLRSGGNLDGAVLGFMGSITRWTLVAATVIAALGAVGIETTSVVAIFASAGLAVGLALQGSLGNFASGVMILIFRPFELGQTVTAGGETGVITDIGLFATTMTTPDNHVIVVPNSAVTGGTITNYTKLGTRRGAIDVGVAYGTSVQEVHAAIEAALTRCDLAKQDPAPGIAFVEMGASSINFKVFCFAEVADFLGMLDQVRSEIYRELLVRGIDIPFDQLVIHRAEESISAMSAA